MARALVTGGGYRIDELRLLLKGKEIKLSGESSEEAKRSNGRKLFGIPVPFYKPIHLEERLAEDFQGEIRFDPTKEQGQFFSKVIEYYPELDIFIYKGMCLGY